MDDNNRLRRNLIKFVDKKLQDLEAFQDLEGNEDDSVTIENEDASIKIEKSPESEKAFNSNRDQCADSGMAPSWTSGNLYSGPLTKILTSSAIKSNPHQIDPSIISIWAK